MKCKITYHEIKKYWIGLTDFQVLHLEITKSKIRYHRLLSLLWIPQFNTFGHSEMNNTMKNQLQWILEYNSTKLIRYYDC